MLREEQMHGSCDATPLPANARTDQFALTILDAVDGGLLVLGEGVRHTLYYHLERSQRIKREEIPERLEAFHEALRGLLGEGGKVVERLIARSLYDSLGLNFEEHHGFTLLDYVNQARRTRGL